MVNGLLVRRDRQIGQIPMPDQALGAGFPRGAGERAQVFGVVHIEGDARQRKQTQGFPVALAAA